MFYFQFHEHSQRKAFNSSAWKGRSFNDAAATVTTIITTAAAAAQTEKLVLMHNKFCGIAYAKACMAYSSRTHFALWILRRLSKYDSCSGGAFFHAQTQEKSKFVHRNFGVSWANAPAQN